MRRITFVTILSSTLLLALPASAQLVPPSSAATRMEFLVPGLSVQVLESCSPPTGTLTCTTHFGDPAIYHPNEPPYTYMLMDALGNVYDTYNIQPPLRVCENVATSSQICGLGRLRPDLSYEEVLRIVPRCEEGTYSDSVIQLVWNLDPVAGSTLMTVLSNRQGPDGTRSDDMLELARLSGLPSLFDIVASYTPAPPGISWNVPVMPDAFPGQADHFDVLAGNLATLPNLTAAQPIACGVPSGRAPVAGEALSVADPLPDPAPRSGRYYLVAASRGDEMRLGRQLVGGVTSGRPVARLAGCQ